MNFSANTKRNAIKYITLTILGIVLFCVGAKIAMKERGYFAIGGEVFALFLPALYAVFSRVIRDFINELKGWDDK